MENQMIFLQFIDFLKKKLISSNSTHHTILSYLINYCKSNLIVFQIWTFISQNVRPNENQYLLL
jgi:hypothetical protein